jgi:hypothetical protein
MSEVFENDVNDVFDEYMLSGNGEKLLDAIRRCGQYGMPIPNLIHREFSDCLEKYVSGESRTLDDAFSVKRKKAGTRTPKSLPANKLAPKKYLGLAPYALKL